MWALLAFSFRIPWIFWIYGCNRFHRNFLMINRFPCNFSWLSTIQIQKTPIIPDFHLSRQVSLLLFPSTRQSVHLAASLENSTLRRVLNFFFSWRQVSLKMFLQACWCNRIFRGWGTRRDSWRQVYRHKLWFCHNSFFFLLFLHPLRHRFGAANQAGILSAARRAEMADVEKMKKTVPFITCEIAFGQNLCMLVFGVSVPYLDLGFLTWAPLWDTSLWLSS